MYNIRTLEQFTSVASWILQAAVVIHFNSNSIQSIYSSDFVPRLSYTQYVKVPIFNSLTNPLELPHFKICANMIFMKYHDSFTLYFPGKIFETEHLFVIYWPQSFPLVNGMFMHFIHFSIELSSCWFVEVFI